MSRTSARSALALIASITLIALVAAPPALAAPTASFTVSAPPRVNGSPVTFTSTATAPDLFTITNTEWDFSYDGVNFNVEGTGTPVPHTFATPGTYTVALRATSSEPLDNQAIASQPVTITQANRAPTSVFTFLPLGPLVGQDVLFASNSTDPDNDNLTHLWNFGDGVTSPLRNPTHAFSTPGPKNVTLRVTDPSNASHTSTRQVVVLSPPVASPPVNQAPIANFAFGPTGPRVGDSVQFVSSAVDPDGELRVQAWDLDGDGEFDDARGDEVLYTFATPGTHAVRLRVEDAAGAAAVRERTVAVRPAPVARAGFLTPSPVILLNGQILGNGARIKVLRIRAPKGALVTVKCRGKGCPVERRRKRVKSGSVRFKTFERFLRAGIRLEIFVSKPKAIGDYTRYKIRAGKFPARTNRCLQPGKNTPSPCRSRGASYLHSQRK